jgi:2-polyprenyl-3-methyl-5-hydroxy-6-metoxy-1,4-benzoquinol methylase
MASSFLGQIPIIIYILTKISPTKILDIGKGFGKYGFLIHEYLGIDNQKKIIHNLQLREQSKVIIDAVEIDSDLMLPHLEHVYDKIIFGNILETYSELEKYDLILMIDIIEHLEKEPAVTMLKEFLKKGNKILIATPRHFFKQYLFESKFEEHVSHWSVKDFKSIGYVDYQLLADGAVYLVSNEPINIIGFGRSIVKKIKRIGRAIKNEI